MNNIDYKQKLKSVYSNSYNISDIVLPEYIKQELEFVAKRVSQNKAVYTVLITLAFYKLCHPKQDIRQHKVELKNGFSGRSFDTKYVTPTLKELGLPAMAETGWLTRSLEQAYAYDMNFNGKISPEKLKIAFLSIVDYIQNSANNAHLILRCLLNIGIIFKNKNIIKINKIENQEVQIETVISILKLHFEEKYHTHGASKLPVLAFYAIYSILINELDRFKGCALGRLGSHTASDRTSKTGGDIEIFKNSKLFEALEIKLDKAPTVHMARIAYEKINKFSISRYYILSGYEPMENEIYELNKFIQKVKEEHGCQLIVNGLYFSLKYYLRLLSNPTLFINKYVELVEQDKELQPIHKEKLKELISKYLI